MRPGRAAAVVTLLALSLATFAYVTTETLPIGLLPLIGADLGRSDSQIGLLVTAYGLVVVLATVPLTRVTQRLPRRLLLSVLLGVFVVATAAAALASTYWLLLGARVVTALSQALFWAVITPAVAAMFRPEVRARAISVLYAGSSVGALAGVPAGTWLGQQTSWRVAFLALSGVGVLILVVVATAMPNRPAGQSDADRGSAPDAGRYWALVVQTALTVTGAFAFLTYLSPFLTEVTGFGEAAVGPMLFVRGLAGLFGVVAVGFLIARNGWLTMTALVTAQAVALVALWLAGDSPAATVTALAVGGFALAALAAGLGARVLEVAPHSTDMGAAGTSTAFNVGITLGALFGSVLLPSYGVRSTALAGAVLSVAALAVVAAEPLVSTRRRAARGRDVSTGTR